ncbi:hypothetical protein [Actinoallomurus acanthiterrae]
MAGTVAFDSGAHIVAMAAGIQSELRDGGVSLVLADLTNVPP